MTQTRPDNQGATLLPSELLDVAKKQIESLLEVQKELMQTLEGINHELFNRAKKEADLASEFVGKLAAARSVPDATTTYQEWATKEMELLPTVARCSRMARRSCRRAGGCSPTACTAPEPRTRDVAAAEPGSR